MFYRFSQNNSGGRACQMTADLDALEKLTKKWIKDSEDAERWRKVESLMVHQHRGDAVGWTLDCLLPGDDPSAAIDSARGKK